MSESNVRPGAPGFPHTVAQGAKTPDKTIRPRLTDEQRKRLLAQWLGLPTKTVRRS